MSRCHLCSKPVTQSSKACTFRCLQGHSFITCGKCLSRFADKCHEVTSKLEDAFKQYERQHSKRWDSRRVNNCSEAVIFKMHCDAREQKKQLDRAEASGELLCPIDVPDNRNLLVPFCVYALTPSRSLDKSELRKVCEDENEPGDALVSKSAVADASPQAQIPDHSAATLHDMADLELIKPSKDDATEGADGDDVLARGKARMKKKQGKVKKEKQIIHLVPDRYQELDDSGAEDSLTPVGAGRSLYEHATLHSLVRPSWAPPEPTENSIAEVSAMLNITRDKAHRLLEEAGGSVEMAVSVFFAQQTESKVAAAAVARPESVASVASTTAGTQSLSMSTSSTASTPSATARGGRAEVDPPPDRPPPPKLPQGWKAEWCASVQNYYYWHLETMKTQWDVPLETPAAGTEEQTRSAKATGSTDLVPTTAAKNISETLVQDFSNITGCDRQASLRYLSDSNGNLEAAIRAQQTPSTGEPSAGGSKDAGKLPAAAASVPVASKPTPTYHGECLCTQNWLPSRDVADATVCLTLVHGERLLVSWTDSQEGGWAYAEVVGTGVKGYCPQAVLVPAPPAPKPMATGDRFRVLVAFREPQHVKGYVPVEPGDEVIVEHPVEEPVVWAYVTRMASRESPKRRGWLPVCVLHDSQGHGPARAG